MLRHELGQNLVLRLDPFLQVCNPLLVSGRLRTFAKLAHKGRAALEQIQLSLGHQSIQTTERYLGVRQDLTDAPCDRLGLKLSGFGE